VFNYIPNYHSESPVYGHYGTVKIPPGGVVTLYGLTTETGKNDRLSLGYYFRRSANSYGEDVYWQILSEDGTELKTWNYSDIGSTDQRFFEESSWLYEEKPGEGGFIVAEYSWTFEIQPEDISLTTQ
jgi:hypothetical protein